MGDRFCRCSAWRPLLIAMVLFSTGCLGPTFRVPGSELDRLAQTPPETRGQSIRAVQQIGRKGRLRPQDEVGADDGSVAIILPVVRHHGPRRGFQRGGPRATTRTSRATVRVRGEGRATPGSPTVRVSGGRGSGRRFGGGRSGRSGGGGGSDSGRGAAAAVAVVVIAAAAVAIGAVAIAATEGYRWDGWVGVEPQHPIHLYRNSPEGRLWLQLGLDQLDPEVAAWADGGLLDGREGRLLGVGRAPLNRRGFALEASAIMSSVDILEGMRGFGGGVRVGIGGFPLQYLGVLAFADIEGASDVVNVRAGGELQAYLPPAGRAHFGLYGEGGWVRSRRDLPEDVVARRGRAFGGGGLLFQIDLTARMALTARGGLWTTEGRAFPTFGLGFSVY